MSKPLSLRIINAIFKVMGAILPIKKRVLFLGSPRSKNLMENGQLVYDRLNCKKKLIVKIMPHHVWDIIYISFFILTSKVIVIDDCYRYFAYIPLKSNQRLVQMWHGPGMFKKTALDVPSTKLTDHYVHEQYDAFINTSPDISYYVEKAFNLKSENVKNLGYPRSDLLINHKIDLEINFYNDFPDLKGKKIFLYLPTYRRYEDGIVLDYDYEINWKKLDEYLLETNSVFLVKRHPLQIHHNLEVVPDYCQNVLDMGELSYFPMMAASDVLITDFSSVFFDYLVLDKPIIFYCPDIEEYLDRNGMYLRFPEDLPGSYCENFEELLNLLKQDLKAIDNSEFKKMQMQSCDGHSTEKVVKLIEDYYYEDF